MDMSSRRPVGSTSWCGTDTGRRGEVTSQVTGSQPRTTPGPMLLLHITVGITPHADICQNI